MRISGTAKLGIGNVNISIEYFNYNEIELTCFFVSFLGVTVSYIITICILIFVLLRIRLEMSSVLVIQTFY